MLRKRVGSVISNQRKTDDSRGVVTREEQFEKDFENDDARLMKMNIVASKADKTREAVVREISSREAADRVTGDKRRVGGVAKLESCGDWHSALEERERVQTHFIPI